MNARRVVRPYGSPSRERPIGEKAGRTCAEKDCGTVLNRYNKTDRCGVHMVVRLVTAKGRAK